MNRKISVGMTVTIVILAMTVTFSITMLMAMRLFDHTVTSVKEKESMYNKVAEVDQEHSCQNQTAHPKDTLAFLLVHFALWPPLTPRLQLQLCYLIGI